uniref:Ubiquitin-conjugating enzyme E2 Z n=1 Tax=viral metagenome TaxID=1070528 RepID=A0A6C0B5C7_9ZZZZ
MKATFNDNANVRAKSRILYDAKNIEKNSDNLNNHEGLYFKFNTDGNVFSTKYNMLIIGPDDSPYAGGFYLFASQFPDQYPYRPMKMTSLTQGGGIRKHPNLYRCGKCCFSFLGTWTGPPWTACQNPTTVGISMRSVFTNNPINNEPGWEKKCDARTKLYETLIRYFNIRYAVIEVVKNVSTSNKYSLFKDAIIKVFKQNYLTYKNEITKFQHLDGKETRSPVYNFTVNINCDSLHKELDYLYNTLTNGGDTPINIVSKSKRKAPEKPASIYETGTIMKGLDSRSWKVKEYANGSKRWVLDK